ncbi:MAG: sugar phosphate isomerase/epimerase family protein [Anaerolineae bacterium]
MTDKRIPVALQLYTVRDQTERDFLGTLKQVAAIGYSTIELAGTGGLGAQELKQALDDLGLRCIGGHVSIDQLDQDLEGSIATYRTLGAAFITIPYLPESLRPDAAGYRAVAQRLNAIGAACAQENITLCYHNHSFEFERFDGRYGLEILLEASDPALLKWQADVFWIAYAGLEPGAWLRRYPGRVPLIHLKDGYLGVSPVHFAEVGEGEMGFKAVFAAAATAGAQCYIVEQDRCDRPSLESAALSLKNLKAWGIA